MDRTHITDMQPQHWDEVADIYREGIQTGQATFETTVPTWADWDQAHLTSCRLVAIAANMSGDGQHCRLYLDAVCMQV